MSVSRDDLRGLPWAAHSTVNLAWRRAIRAAADREVGSASLFDLPPFRETALMGWVDDDPLLVADGAWRAEKMIETSDGDFRSIDDLRARNASGDLPLISAPARLRSGASFHTICSSALLQRHASPVLVFGSGACECRVRFDGLPTAPALALFPPLFFVPYDGSQLLKNADLPLNARHPFANWLLDASERLAEAYPGILRSLRETLGSDTASVSGPTREDVVDKIDYALSRLRALDRKLAPPTSIFPTVDDFG